MCNFIKNYIKKHKGIISFFIHQLTQEYTIKTLFYLFFIFSFFSLTAASLNSNKNLLYNKNFNLKTPKKFKGIEYHEYSLTQSHRDDNSGSIKLIGHGPQKALKSSLIKLKKDTQYIIGAYMKVVGSKYNQNLMFKIASTDDMIEMNWNVSKQGEWEEIRMPFIPKKDNYYYISVFTYKYSLSTDGRLVDKLGTNLDRNGTIYIDDFFIYKKNNALHDIKSIKKIFNSPLIKVDSKGNWSVYENKKWKDFFPKLAYQDWRKDSFKYYKQYGFTGIANIQNEKNLNQALNAGLKYNAIQINRVTPSLKSFIKKTKDNPLYSSSIIMYNFDNEGVALSNQKKVIQKLEWIKNIDNIRPIYMLNGVAEGVARRYNNYADVTGTYASRSGNEIEVYKKPINSFSILQEAQYQKIPVSIVQMQCYYHNLFIPYLFKSIGNGAKGLMFWRGGKTASKFKCPKDFTQNKWASDIKGKDGVFAKIDKLLPIIREPLYTNWSATVDNKDISIATRDHNGVHYLILTNFSNKKQKVLINLENLKISKVKNFFTKKSLLFLKNNQTFNVEIEKHNKGYLVLEII